MSEPEEQRLRVAMLGAFPPQSQGVVDYCAELVRALSGDYQVTALGFAAMYPSIFYPGESSSVDPTREKMDEPHLAVRHILTYYNPLSWIRAALFTPADVFHAQWWSLPLWPVTLTMTLLMRCRGKRVVITVHNALAHDRSSLYVPASRMLCSLAHKLVVHSRQNREQVAKHYRIASSRICEVAHGSFESKARRLPAATSRKELGIAEDARVVLLYGALRGYKGIDVLLRAFSEVARAIDRARLLIAGKKWVDWQPYGDIVKNAGLGRQVVLWLQYVPEDRVPVFFSAADIVVLPYTSFDAQSGVAATAVPFRKPMIVTRAGGLPEWVDDDEEWIVPPGDAAALARRLIYFFENQVAQEAEFSRIAERVLPRFSWRHIARSYASIYQP